MMCESLHRLCPVSHHGLMQGMPGSNLPHAAARHFPCFCMGRKYYNVSLRAEHYISVSESRALYESSV